MSKTKMRIEKEEVEGPLWRISVSGKPKLILNPEVARRAAGAMVEHSGTVPKIGRAALDSDHFNGI
jgi:hypothetical protein